MSLLKVFFAVVVSLCIATASSAENTPKVTLSVTRIVTPGHVMVQGSGFTPKQNVSSHLLSPEGKEYPVIPILTDDRGEFTHDIDTLLLAIGTHQLWVVDDSSRVSSNRTQFEVTAN